VYHGFGLFRDFVPAFTKTYSGGDPRAPAPPCYERGSHLRQAGDFLTADPATRRGIPDATVARLPEYLRALTELAERGIASVSSEELATVAGVRSAKLRKDLSHLGSYGVRGVGYAVEMLAHEISRELGLSKDRPVAIVGLGNLGHALAAYSGFATRGFRVVALLDCDHEVVGREVAGMTVDSVEDLERIVREKAVIIGVIATPAAAAQVVCDRLVAVGVRSILNFAPCVLSVPEGVVVRKVDLATELQILAFHERREALAASEHLPLLEVAP
jgi:redox-sensing transcriptional repressor